MANKQHPARKQQPESASTAKPAGSEQPAWVQRLGRGLRSPLLWKQAILAVLAVGLYVNSIPNAYNLDDDLVTAGNRKTTFGLSGDKFIEIWTRPYFDTERFQYEYRPVTHLTFALETELLHRELPADPRRNIPPGYHLQTPQESRVINILLYALLVVVLFRVLRRVFAPRWEGVVWLGVLFFTVHPAHTEVVVSLKNRDEILTLLFGLLALGAGRRFVDGAAEFPRGWRRLLLVWLLAIGLFVLSLLSKRSLLLFPFLLSALLVLTRGSKPLWIVVLAAPLAAAATLLAPIFLLWHKVVFALALTLGPVAVWVLRYWLVVESPGAWLRRMGRELAGWWNRPSVRRLRGRLRRLVVELVLLELVRALGRVWCWKRAALAAAWRGQPQVWPRWAQVFFAALFAGFIALAHYVSAVWHTPWLWLVLLVMWVAGHFSCSGAYRSVLLVGGALSLLLIVFLYISLPLPGGFVLLLVLVGLHERMLGAERFPLGVYLGMLAAIVLQPTLGPNGLEFQLGPGPLANKLVYGLLPLLVLGRFGRTMQRKHLAAAVLVLLLLGQVIGPWIGSGAVSLVSVPWQVFGLMSLVAALYRSAWRVRLAQFSPVTFLLLLGLTVAVQGQLMLPVNFFYLNSLQAQEQAQEQTEEWAAPNALWRENTPAARTASLRQPPPLRLAEYPLPQQSGRQAQQLPGQAPRLARDPAPPDTANLPPRDDFFAQRARQLIPNTERDLELIENHLVAESLWERAPDVLHVLAFYARLAVFPHPLGYYYGYAFFDFVNWADPLVWLSLLGHLVLLGLFFWGVKRLPLLSAGVLWYLVSVLVFSNLWAPVAGVAADRLLFAPSVGSCLLLALVVVRLGHMRLESGVGLTDWLRQAPVFAWVAVGLVVAAASYAVVDRNTDWENRLTLYEHDMAYLNNSSHANYMLGNTYIFQADSMRSNPQQQRQLYQKAFRRMQRSLEIWPEYHLAAYYTGYAAFRVQDYRSAIHYLRYSVKLDSTYPEAYFRLGGLYEIVAEVNQQAALLDSAVYYYRQVMQLQPRRLVVYNNLSFLLFRMGRLQESVEVNERAVEVLPEAYDPYINMGRTLLQMERYAEAYRRFQQAYARNDSDRELLGYLLQFAEYFRQPQQAQRYRRRLQELQYQQAPGSGPTPNP